MNIITVGIGELRVSKEECVLESISLGSCVGIALYDPGTKISGLAHIMLPSSALSVRGMANPTPKFADVAVKKMLEDMKKLGAVKPGIVAKIAGGACMFQSAMADPAMNIGERNVAAVRQLMRDEKISIVAEDTGKDYGRTIQFNSVSGKLLIKSARVGNKEI
ncbi:MAG: hypothetical protein A2314_07780 [Elusimicrobia bacterium RIFOXYB2_FULL_50_12]|nr:MAG: hypothetical protein A2314_07780 [Elusimicrobia bacterium RIFOXYB2_FULL_50_12]